MGRYHQIGQCQPASKTIAGALGYTQGLIPPCSSFVNKLGSRLRQHGIAPEDVDHMREELKRAKEFSTRAPPVSISS